MSHKINSCRNSARSKKRFTAAAAVTEALEDRLFLSGTHYVVDTLSMDIAVDGHISFAEALSAAYNNEPCNEAPMGVNEGGTLEARDEITFAEELFSDGPVTIDISSLDISAAARSGQLKITGPGSDLLTLDASEGTLTTNFAIDAEMSGFTFIGAGAVIVTNANCVLDDIKQLNPSSGGFSVRENSTVTMTGCQVTGSESGIYIDESTVTATDCVFSNNEQAIGLNYSELALNDSIVCDNHFLNENYGGVILLGLHSEVTITGCDIYNNSSSGKGGAITLMRHHNKLVLVDTNITNNSSDAYGGAISSDSPLCELQITDCVITGNTAAESGGGIYWNDAISQSNQPLTIQGSTISNNTAGKDGGGVFVGFASQGLVILDSEFTNNTAEENGGGLCLGGELAGGYTNGAGELTLESVIFEHNGSGAYGGGVFLLTEDPCHINNSQFIANYSNTGGAVALSYNSDRNPIDVSNSRFYGNCASAAGGVFYGAAITSIQNMYVGNQANDGVLSSHGPYHYNPTWIGTSDTIASNVAMITGGAIFSCRTEVYMNLFYNNTVDGQPKIVDSGYTQYFSGDYNFFDVLETADIDGSYNIGGTISEPADPMFVANPDPGETSWGNSMGTPWIDESLDNYYGDLNLQATSPAIATEILPVEQLQQIALDINGNARWLGDGPDYGAIEYTGQSEATQYTLTINGQQVTSDQLTVYFNPLLVSPAEITISLTHNNPSTLPVYVTITRDGGTGMVTVSDGISITNNYTYNVDDLDSANIDIVTNDPSLPNCTINWMPTAIGDASLDGTVDLDDFITLKQHYGNSEASWADGDFNGDGKIDLDDFILLKQNYGTSAAESAAAAEAATGAPASTTDQQSPSEAVAAVAMKAPTLNLTTDLSWQAPSITLASSEVFDCLAAAAMAS